MADVRKESGQLLADASRSRARTARNSIPASTSSAMRESLSVAALHEKAAIHSGAFDGPMWRATVTQEKKEKQNANDLCGWMGVEVRPMTAAFAASLGMAVPYGAISDQPEPGSPAGAAVTREAEEDWTR